MGKSVSSKRLTMSVVLAVLAVSPVFAQEAAPAATSAETAAPAAEAAAAPVAVATTTVPKLKITWDCGECEHNDAVPPLIEQAYAAEAQKHALTVSETDVAEVTITDIRQRPPGVRVMFGFMAGKDRLGLHIQYAGHAYDVSDTSANAVMGLNHLSASVGKQAYEQLSVQRH